MAFSQYVPVQSINESEVTEELILELKNKFGQNKILPTGFETQTLIALSYFPELKETKIFFQVKKDKTPLLSRPYFTSVFKANKNRTYLILISSESYKFLEPILLQNMNFNAQIGVLGHEISHIVTYTKMSFWGFVKLGFGMLSSSYVDKLEYDTDKITIEHGLGFQLLAWSEVIATSFSSEEIKDKFGKMMKKERYMFPSTIKSYIQKYSTIYEE